MQVQRCKSIYRTLSAGDIAERIKQRLLIYSYGIIEKHIYKLVDVAWALKEEDKEMLESFCAVPRVDIVPNVVEPEMMRDCSIPPSDNGKSPVRCVFIGDYSYQPNEQCAFTLIDWFSDKRIEATGVTLFLIGVKPSPSMKRKAERTSNVVITDEVADLGEYLHPVDVIFLAPLLSGGGVKRKVIEAMAYGCPVITTVVGAEGLDLIDGETALSVKADYHVIVVRSTIIPGTLEHVIRPIIESHSLKTCNLDFGLCFQPEFMREGSSIQDFYNPPYTVVGGDSEQAIGRVKEIFAHLPCEFIVTTVQTAEMLKYCCNTFHALKVAFANEIGRISQPLEVDAHMVMDLLCRDTKLNISPAYLKPGFAFGGSCLPKDVRALTYQAKQRDVSLPVLAAILPSNRAPIERAVEIVLESGKKNISMLGLSFKGGTDDLRESPLVVLAEQFIGKGLSLRIYDPEVNTPLHITPFLCNRIDDLVIE